MATNEPSIGVCLSGGGHRASTWALGAMLYLADQGTSARVASIASVSGGSITNGYVATRLDYSKAAPEEFEKAVAAPLASRLANTGTVFADRASGDMKRSVIGLGIAIAVLAAVGLLLLPALSIARWLGVRASLGTALAASGVVLVLIYAAVAAVLVVLGTRGRITRDGYDRELFGGQRLAGTAREVEHVFCATDVQFAEHVYWSPRFVYAYRLGVGNPGDLRLADAVAASAAFPGAFPPLVVPSSRFGFEHGAEPLPTNLVLYDGGVYDNMADQWFVGVTKRLAGTDRDEAAAQRAEALRAVVKLLREPDQLLVVNATAAFDDSPIDTTLWPVSEVLALAQMVLALHDNSSSLRRKHLVAQFEKNANAAGVAPGTLVHIGTNPEWTVADALSRPPGPIHARAATAAALLAAPLGAGNTRVDWDDLKKRNGKIPTQLEPLGREAVADLLQHAYVLTAVQCHVYLAHPLPPEAEWVGRFGRERFAGLV